MAVLHCRLAWTSLIICIYLRIELISFIQANESELNISFFFAFYMTIANCLPLSLVSEFRVAKLFCDLVHCCTFWLIRGCKLLDLDAFCRTFTFGSCACTLYCGQFNLSFCLYSALAVALYSNSPRKLASTAFVEILYWCCLTIKMLLDKNGLKEQSISDKQWARAVHPE